MPKSLVKNSSIRGEEIATDVEFSNFIKKATNGNFSNNLKECESEEVTAGFVRT